MSRDHYIPQVLLKRFAEAGTGKKSFVFQYGKDHCVRATTRDVAVEKYFHGKDGDLEHQFSQIEGEWAHLLRQIDEHQSSDVCTLSEQINNLVWTLVIRTRYFREATNSASSSATQTVGETFQKTKNRIILRKRAEATLLNNINLATQDNPIITQQEIRKRKAQARKRIRSGEFDDHLAQSMRLGFDQVNEMINSTDLMRDAHNRILAETIESSKPSPEFLMNLTWRKVSQSEPPIVLGDSVAFCTDENDNIRPLIGSGRDFTYCFLPISRNTILIGSQSNIERNFEPEFLQKGAIQSSESYFYSHTKSDGLTELANELIGRSSEFINSADINSLGSSFWSDFDARTDTMKKKS